MHCCENTSVGTAGLKPRNLHWKLFDKTKAARRPENLTFSTCCRECRELRQDENRSSRERGFKSSTAGDRIAGEVPFSAFRRRSGAFSRAVHGQLPVQFMLSLTRGSKESAETARAAAREVRSRARPEGTLFRAWTRVPRRDYFRFRLRFYASHAAANCSASCCSFSSRVNMPAKRSDTDMGPGSITPAASLSAYVSAEDIHAFLIQSG